MPRLESLECRKVMAAGLGSMPAALAYSTFHREVSSLNASDTNVQSSGSGLRLRYLMSGQVEVTGSDLDDRVEIRYGSNNTLVFDLKSYDRNGRLASHEIVSILNIDWVPNIHVSGNAGSDLVWNQTHITMVAYGGDGDDYLIGGSGIDWLRGDRGNDTLLGFDGDDNLNGGDGDDWLDGGRGNDQLSGWHGNDTMFGGDGNDEIRAWYGTNRIWGDAGHDTIYGGTGDDEIHGDNALLEASGGGNDVIYAGSGDDDVRGGSGDDTIDGGSGDDILRGGRGNDRIFGRQGADRIYGDDGDDYLDPGDDLYFIDYVWGGAGRDTFVRHRWVFSSLNRVGYDDVFADFLSGTDRVETDWHW